ncbi:MAG: DUF2071 domain-containing protein [Verrucomicrobia bacterium]|nr:DUF2071 domain-containing protein [Verrucomicrobiota bacterium]
MKMENARVEKAPLNEISRRKMLAHGEHFLLSNWRQVAFFHYAVKPEFLQSQVPFELDLYEGKAYVSGVAFYLEKLRPKFGGALGAAFMKPIANHELLNIRTYVRHNGETGIYFLAEFLPNLLSAQLGPRFCGLPYRYAKLAYHHEPSHGKIAGQGRAGGNCIAYTGKVNSEAPFRHCEEGSLEEFVLERYTAFTWRKRIIRSFRVWHPAWCHTEMGIEIQEDALLKTTGDWVRRADLIGAHYSPGFDDVWMGWPRRF